MAAIALLAVPATSQDQVFGGWTKVADHPAIEFRWRAVVGSGAPPACELQFRSAEAHNHTTYNGTLEFQDEAGHPKTRTLELSNLDLGRVVSRNPGPGCQSITALHLTER